MELAHVTDIGDKIREYVTTAKLIRQIYLDNGVQASLLFEIESVIKLGESAKTEADVDEMRRRLNGIGS